MVLRELTRRKKKKESFFFPLGWIKGKKLGKFDFSNKKFNFWHLNSLAA